jgi:glycosyltransferase involved in cell wall biosynthesis
MLRTSGFTIIRNARRMGYPIIQSIKSLLPVVDEMVVGVGQSDDDTVDLVLGLGDPKIKLFHSIWDETKTKGGLILSEKTNEALARCKGDWCFYLQADEVLHEQDYPAIQRALADNANDQKVEGLLFKYVHFYGAYDVVATARNWYRREVRVIRRESGARSVGDAQGFRVGERKPFVREVDASVYHYGWVKPPKRMGEKNKLMFRWWHGNKFDDAFDDFSYKSSYGLRQFSGAHPAVMKDLVATQDWKFCPRMSWRSWTVRDVKNVVSDVVERATGLRLGEHKNFQVLKR